MPKKVTDTIFEGLPVHEWAVIKTSEIIFSPELLDYCKANACGQYNKSWTCPPVCETIEKQREKILSYENALVFTTKHELEDSFDYEGMNHARERHTLLTVEIRKRLDNAPVFGAGACPVCKGEKNENQCCFPQPCPFPGKKIGSIEAAGINVTELSKAAGIAYNNGINTVTYFSMVLLK
jgi:predicted metal-binding protein